MIALSRLPLAVLLLALSCGGQEAAGDSAPASGGTTAVTEGTGAAANDASAANAAHNDAAFGVPGPDVAATTDEGGRTLTIPQDSTDPLAEQRLAQLEPSRSRLVFETLERDLGVVFQDEDVPVEFPFRVDGPDPVVLLGHGSSDNLPVSCGCTDAHVRPDWLGEAYDVTIHGEAWDLDQPIPAGASGTVVATFHGNRYERIKKSTVTVRGNMQGGPYLLEVIADVKPVFQSRPTQIMFGKVLAGALRDKDPQVEVQVTAKQAFEVQRWKSLPLGVSVEEIGEPEALSDGRSLQTFRFTLGQEAKVGMLNAAALAETDIGSDYEIVMSAQVVGPVRFRPENRLMFGFWDAGAAQTRTVKVDLQVAGGSLPVPHVTLAGSIAAQLDVEVVTLREGASYEVRVTAGADTPPGSYDGTLTLDFGDSDFPSQQLTVKAMVREAKP